MENLDRAIRSRQWQLREKRTVVAELERLALKFRAEIEHLETVLKQEQIVASRNTEAATGYSNYVQAVITRRDKLRQSLSELERKMVHADKEVAAALQEFKKLELIRSRKRGNAALETPGPRQEAADDEGAILHSHETSH